MGVGATLLILSRTYSEANASISSAADNSNSVNDDVTADSSSSNSTASHVPLPPGQKRKAVKPPLATTNRVGIDPLSDIIDTSLFAASGGHIKPFPVSIVCVTD